ncbi:hypothetical protein RR46_00033 [Papilio xuthus]|uniref:Uncharacterized protein n=1 Tax=Papilio xuthus TaxID=66420 RepID=A0A0N0PEY5_PAPXU|nr:hypothetical protein RR46_00033 [Papilio xuthus]
MPGMLNEGDKSKSDTVTEEREVKFKAERRERYRPEKKKKRSSPMKLCAATTTPSISFIRALQPVCSASSSRNLQHAT